MCIDVCAQCQSYVLPKASLHWASMAVPELSCNTGRCHCRQSGGRGAQERLTLAQLIVPKEDLPPADAKPQWHTLTATIAQIDPNQSMYYEACPDNNRKACCLSPRCPQLQSQSHCCVHLMLQHLSFCAKGCDTCYVLILKALHPGAVQNRQGWCRSGQGFHRDRH